MIYTKPFYLNMGPFYVKKNFQIFIDLKGPKNKNEGFWNI